MPRWSCVLAVGAILAGALVIAAPSPSPASANSYEWVETMSVQAVVDSEGLLTITETLGYQFGDQQRRGIYRDLPLEDALDSGGYRGYEITDIVATMDGAPAMTRTDDMGTTLRIYVGDPAKTVTGYHTYEIRYNIKGALRPIHQEDISGGNLPPGVEPGDVELYWDLVGGGWEVSLYDVVVSVRGPAPTLATACWWGPQDSVEPCLPQAPAREVEPTWGPYSVLQGDSMTVSVVWPAEAFSIIPAVSDYTVSRQARPFITGGVAAIVVFPIPILIALVLRRRDRGVVIDAAPPQYSPPDGLRPAQLGAALDGKSMDGARMTVATLLDLAARGFIQIRQDGMTLSILRPAWHANYANPEDIPGHHPSEQMQPWEAGLLHAMFSDSRVYAELDAEGQPTWRGIDLASTFNPLLASWVASSTLLLTSEAEHHGRRNPHGDRADKKWGWLALAGFLGAFASLVLAGITGSTWIAIIAMPALSLLLGAVAAQRITPRHETKSSALFAAKARGLQVVLSTEPAEARRRFANETGLSPSAIFATMLPYAVMLKVDSDWMAAFPEVTPDDLRAQGLPRLSPTTLSPFMSQAASTFSSATTSPMAAAGGSGSGGGGRSGGGGGGGGGGSW